MENKLDPNQALQILAKAAESYANSLDELARAFAVPNLQAAISTIAAALNKETDNDPAF